MLVFISIEALAPVTAIFAARYLRGSILQAAKSLAGSSVNSTGSGWDYRFFDQHRNLIIPAGRWERGAKLLHELSVASDAHRLYSLSMDRRDAVSSINSKEFENFFHARSGSPDVFAVAALTDEDRRLFGVAHDRLWLSRVSLDEHKARHPEVTIDDYRMIPEILRRGEVWGGHTRRRYVLLLIDGKPYRASIKSDAQDQDACLLSLVISGKQKPPKGAVRSR